MAGFLATGIMFLCMACAIYALHHFMKETGRRMTWWKWVLSVLWLVLVMVTFATIGTFIGEGASQAVLPGGGFFIVLCIISGAVVFYLLLKTKKDEAAS